MKFTVCIVLLFFIANVMSAQGNATSAEFDVNAAERFANLALACVHKEYPNKISHTLNSDADVAPPRKLTPAFYGCYDWHSSVHGHWLLVRLVRTFPDAHFCAICTRSPAAKPDRRKHRAGSGVPPALRDAPVLNAPMDWRGCFNWLRNCASGTTLRLAKWRRTCARWSRLAWNG